MTPSRIHNKRKIINDPVYGFIDIPDDLIYDLVEHPYFQRLRRIRQLGLTFYVYPAATHTRFQHALGAAYLMSNALEVIQSKANPIDPEDCLGALIAILLHDIGHGPFSHALENIFIDELNHENLSLMFMESLNEKFNKRLRNAIDIFRGEHKRPFLHQLVSGQLDVDRLDYLRRDSFFTGVSEGVVGSDRIIKMLRVVDDQLVVDKKGIYSIEKYLISRRLMYWQVYLHKTVVVAEQMLVSTLRRAKQLASEGSMACCAPALETFLYPDRITIDPRNNPDGLLTAFAKLDDNDVITALKTWTDSNDVVLSMLSEGLINRRLLGVEIQNEEFDLESIQLVRDRVMKKLSLSTDEVSYLVISDEMSNMAYSEDSDELMIRSNNGQLARLSDVSDIVNVPLLAHSDKKYFLCAPKWAM